MSTGSAGPAGVRNLRAMFENKSSQNDQSTSPPSRGRSSPNGSTASASSRPVSKVRTNFVAVEKPESINQSLPFRLRKQSDVSSVIETRDEITDEEKSSIMADEVDTHALKGGLGSILKGSAFETVPEPSKPDGRVQTGNSTEAAGTPVVNGTNSTVATPVRAKATVATKSETVPTDDAESTKPVLSNVNTKTPNSKPKETPSSAVKSPVTPKDNGTNGRIKPRGGPAKIQGVIESSNQAKEARAEAAQEEASKDVGPSPSLKSPTTPNDQTSNGRIRPRGGAAKIQGVIESSNRAKEERTEAAQENGDDGENPSSSVKSPVTSEDKSTGGHIKPRGGAAKIQGVIKSSNRAKEERTKMAQEEAGKEDKKPKNIKPPSVASKQTAASKAHAQKPNATSMEQPQLKSPISARAPIKLPSAATATTAASTARKGGSTEKEEPKLATSEKRMSMTTAQVPRVAHASTRASLARKSSRASLTNDEDLPKAKPRLSTTHKPADEHFLARMTRPTASSSQKAHEKVNMTSPPRTRKVSEARKTRMSLPSAGQKSKSEEPVEESILEPVKETTDRGQEDATVANEDGPDMAEDQDADIPPQQAAVMQGTA